MRRVNASRFITLASAAVLAACAVGPDYVRPAAEVQAQFHEKDAAYASGEPTVEFWRGFDDPLLTQLVEESLAANRDLRVALARLDQARALAGLSRFDLLPTVTAEAGHSTARASQDQAPGVARDRRDSHLYEGGVDAFWELDLFGRVRRSAEASRADAAAAAADYRGAQVSVAAEVARTYFELRGFQERLRVARASAANQAETLRLTQARLDAGRGTDFDTSRARAQLEFTHSRIPALEAGVAVAAHRLAVLQGKDPAALIGRLAEPAPLPTLPQTVAVGAPTDLLRRRPDIAAAERRLASATARIGVATADLFPRFTFNGTVGGAATNLGDLFTRDARTYAFGPSVSWAFLDLGRVRTRITAADAGAAGNLALYQSTVLQALEETENALVGYGHARTESDHLAESASASENAARLAHLRFDAGVTDFLDVLEAERSVHEAQDRLAESRARTATALVTVYKAVAGGWPDRVVATTAETGSQ